MIKKASLTDPRIFFGALTRFVNTTTFGSRTSTFLLFYYRTAPRPNSESATMNLISEKFDEKISALKLAFNKNKGVKHNGIKGSLNESELSSIIKEVIPKRYKVTRGIVENSAGKKSNESDISIYDDEILRGLFWRASPVLRFWSCGRIGENKHGDAGGN